MIKCLILLVFSFHLYAADSSLPKLSNDEFDGILGLLETRCFDTDQCEELIARISGMKRVPLAKASSAKRPKVEKPIPDDVRIYRVEEVVAETSNKGNFYISPSKPKNVIYCHFAVNNYWDRYIDINDRINITEVMKEAGIAHHTKLSKTENLHKLLWATELKVRALFKDELILRSIIYVGLAESFSHRAGGHGGDMVHSAEEGLGNRKINYESGLLKDQHNIRMSYFIKNIPSKHLKVFECLIAKLTLIDFGASATIGDNDSWKKLNNYWQSEIRKNGMEASGFDNEIEKLRSEIKRKLLCLDDESEDKENSATAGNI